MIVSELLQVQYRAGEAIGLPSAVVAEIVEAQKPEVIDLGMIAVKMDEGGTRHIHAWRGHSGPAGRMYKGGSRLSNRRPKQDVREMPLEMAIKVATNGNIDAYGRPIGGGKTLYDVNAELMSHTETIRLFEGGAERMHAAGILDHRISVPAGDLGSNHPDYMDAYANRAHELDPSDPYWQAVITGKSARYGGLTYRPHATADGVVRAVEFARRQKGMESGIDVTISGAGNVGGRTGYFLSQIRDHEGDERSPYRIMGYSDCYSTLQVANHSTDTEGILVDEYIANEIFDNPDFKNDLRFRAFNGDKMLALAVVLRERQPHLQFEITNNSTDILTVPSRIFVPASIGHLITEQNIGHIGAEIIVEGANGPTTQMAYQMGLRAGKLIMSGEEANTSGVDCSMDETNGNVNSVRYGTPMPDYDTARHQVHVRAEERFARVERMRQVIGNRYPELAADRRLATYAVGIGNLAIQGGADLDREFREIILQERSIAV